jgi:microcystin-dependent protein
VNTAETEFDTVNKSGGAKTHTLTEAQLASHNHSQNSHSHSQNGHSHTVSTVGTGTPSTYRLISSSSGPQQATQDTSTVAPAINGTTAANNPAGSNQAHNNLQPYLTKYIFQRIW